MELKTLTKLSICFVSVGMLLSGGAGAVFAEDAATLEERIQQRNLELQQINREIAQTQSKLQETQNQKNTLSSEVQRINTSINQINLGIKSSEVAVEKLSLEIEALKGDISSAESDITLKQAAVGELLRALQQQDNESVLFVLLKNNALSDSLFELQALSDLYSNLLVHIDELNDSKQHLEGVLDVASYKREEKTLESKTLQNKKVIAQELKKDKELFLSEVKNKEQEYQKYIEELTDRQIRIAQEIAEIESRLTANIDFKNLPDKLPGLFQTPIERGSFTITQGYGATAFARRVYKSGFHNGIDLGAPLGTPIYASEDGVVLAATNQDKYCYKGAYGRFVVVKHYMGLTTLYAHMSLYTVKEGDTVKRGQIIGYVGNSGLATGPHLHYTIYDSSTFYIDGSRSCGPIMPYGGHIDPHNYVVF